MQKVNTRRCLVFKQKNFSKISNICLCSFNWRRFKSPPKCVRHRGRHLSTKYFIAFIPRMEIQIKTGWLSAVDCQYVSRSIQKVVYKCQSATGKCNQNAVSLFPNENAQPLKRKFLPNGWGRWNTPDMEMAHVYTSASSSLLALYDNHRVHVSNAPLLFENWP